MSSPARIAAFCAIMLSASLAQAQYSYTSFVGSTATFNNPPTTQVKIISRNSATDNNGQEKTYSNTNGGEFVIQWNGQVGVSGGTFEDLEYGYNNLNLPQTTIYKTFCVEANEFINPGGTYWATIDDQAFFNPGATDFGQTAWNEALPTLTDQTKLLYGLYFEGRLDDVYSSYDYEVDVDAGILQKAIWQLEGFAYYNDTAVDSMINWATSNLALGATLQGQVQVLNLWANYDDKLEALTGAKQSQLIYTPGGPSGSPQGPFVPEPATATIWAAGLAACGYRQYRRSRGKKRTA